MKLILALSLVVLACSQAKELGIRRFNGYQVLSVHASSAEQVEVLRELYNKSTMDFWTTPTGTGVTDIMAAPEQLAELTQLLQKNGMTHTVKIADVEEVIEEERVANKKAFTGRMDWNSYPRWSELQPWILSLNDSPVATVSEIGRSFEGRPLYVVKISSGGTGAKKAVFIDANIHAREWISGATATWILNELTTNTAAYADVLSQLDIYIVPFVNIDGYEYAQTTDRLWRKTRSSNPGSTCMGCDPNRNWSFMFGGESTSERPCDDIYTGVEAFSESETRAVRDFIVGAETSGVKFNAYLTFHSYGNYWLLPWGYTQGVYPPDYPEQLSVGTRAIDALRAVHGTRYTVGQGADQLYGVGGASDDWAKDHGIKYTATIEMRGNSFVLPPAQIVPNAQEVWAAIQVYFEQIISEN